MLGKVYAKNIDHGGTVVRENALWNGVCRVCGRGAGANPRVHCYETMVL